MTTSDRDPVTAQDMLDEPDFASEHDKPTFADEHAGRPGMEPDESTPSDRADAGGFNPQAPTS
jgi:hypothetical protein